ncbi:unnamed protein product [Polarella glacialis]|uniref:Uncharacterized protein n=1 Tax=Polarella glacialis TaxID=89957 RepID=A0A813LG19_POLGL|nr:unnamed protein product [Polarella glacialis]
MKLSFYALGFPECIKGVWSSLELARCEEAPCMDIPEVPHALDIAACVNTPSGEGCPIQCEATTTTTTTTTTATDTATATKQNNNNNNYNNNNNNSNNTNKNNKEGYAAATELRCFQGVWLPVACVAHCAAPPEAHPPRLTWPNNMKQQQQQSFDLASSFPGHCVCVCVCSPSISLLGNAC